MNCSWIPTNQQKESDMPNRLWRLATLAFIAIGFLAVNGLPLVHAADPTIRVRMATLAPKGTPVHQALLAMGEKWRQAPGGGVALTVYTDGSMGDEPDMVRRMRVGQLQA